jgi:putative iron-regulated protein
MAVLFGFASFGMHHQSVAQPDTTASVVSHYCASMHGLYSKSAASATALKSAIDAYVKSPTTATLEAAKRAWIDAHRDYSITEIARFYDGPIDEPEKGPEGLINAWPLDEAYIDYVDGDNNSGIINNPGKYPEITAELLVSMNEKDGEKNISTGFHAIEFLLWGQDKNANGPGARPVTDYAANSSAKRRAQYLVLVTDLLNKHIADVTKQWKPAGLNYGTQFQKLPPDRGLQKMLTGIAMMAGDELSKERMAVPLETQDQEDEQSCFSDTTLTDLKQNLAGIESVYTGAYGTKSGPGLQEIFKKDHPEVHRAIVEKLAAAKAAMENIPAPYDNALQSQAGRGKIETAVRAIEELGSALVKAAGTIGLTINLKH